MNATTSDTTQLGLGANAQQFALLVVINGFVGALVGLERTILPLIAEAEFNLVSRSIVLSFLISFGLVKALSNLFAGRLGDRWGRKRILVLGWLVGLPVPLLLIWAPTWNWIVFANVLLGVNQGLCWSTTVIMKIDLVGPKQRGLAMGLNEFAGYMAVSLSALATGVLAASFGFRPVPFIPGLLFAGLGLLLSIFFVQDTSQHVRLEAVQSNQDSPESPATPEPSFRQIFILTSWRNRTLMAVSQAGLVNNLNDGLVWGIVPIFLAGSGLDLGQVALIAATYPAVWGMGQLLTGALSDRWGRKWLIASGMWLQAFGIGMFVALEGFSFWLAAAVLLGAGTAMVYPTLLAAISDVAEPSWRGSAVGVYRLWRDAGFAAGGILAGLLADLYDIPVAIAAVAALTLVSGLVVAVRMAETLPAAGTARA